MEIKSKLLDLQCNIKYLIIFFRLTFLPLSILYRMKSLLNIIFLITSIISCIKILSTKSISSALIPFLMVIGIGLIMDLIEEIKRYRNDLETNGSLTKIYQNKKFRNIKWSDIKIGNLIKVKKDEMIPADLFVICSSNKDISFYLQTSNIDGETNLKKREVSNETQKIFYKKEKKEENYLEKLFEQYKKEQKQEEENCYIKVDPPNSNIYKINGLFFFNGERVIISKLNTAIRGSILKNTKFIYGIVIYTGKETKIMQNFIKPKIKFSYLDKLVDNIIMVIIIVRLFYVLLFMMIGIIYRYKYIPDYKNGKLGYEYIFYYRHTNGKYEKNNSLENIKYFTSNFILSQTLLPTSVAVLLAITKVIQSLFLEFLEKSLRKKPNQKMKCFSSELLGELGSVKYIFCDKTGTLTKNQTQFKACSIFTSLFDESSEKTQTQTQNDNYTSFYCDKSKTSLPPYSSNFSLSFDFNNLLNKLKLRNIPLDVKNIKNCPFKSQVEAIEEFLLNMALNHDIVVDNYKNKNNKIEIKYQGTNPDEITLVGAARELGYFYYKKVKNSIIVKKIKFTINGKEDKPQTLEFQELLKVPFKSERKRSTIIVRDLQNNLIKIYIKGSDSNIIEKINNYSKETILDITKEHIDNFARRGLRTLCYAFNIIPESKYKDWRERYDKVKQNLTEDNEILEDELIEEIEKDCFLLGATALEDQMQDNVKKDIQEFIEAGINFWMLTGDKMETAESIGYAIKLFDSDTEVYKIKTKGENEKEKEIIERLEEIKLKIKEVQSDLSKLTIGDGSLNKEKKMDFNSKFNTFKNNIKDKIKVIYEENEEEEYIKYKDKGKKEDSYDKKIKNNYFIENGSERIPISDKNLYLNNNANENLNNINTIIINFKKEELDKNKNNKKNENEDMSIFKFMIDNKYFQNSNIEFENFSMIKNKVEYPHLVNSFDSEQFNESLNKEKDNDIISINNKEKGNKRNDIRGLNKDKKTNITNKTSENCYAESEMNLLKKEQRLKTNLPIQENDFLDYFSVCISKLREIFYIQQKSLFLFKIPYLYGLINEEKDPLTEDIKKTDWKEKLNLKNYLMKTKIKYSLILNGECIKYCISDKASNLFWFLIQHSRSIICCGCSPIEKAEIVKFVKKHTKETTLAIGDGENDVNMIKEANVGIGIFGKEGSQASFNSDYAFSEFQYLKQLLFVNGRFTLLRNTYFLNMFFFKNFLYTFQGIIYNFSSLYSGNFFYDEFYDSMFNTFVSILPLITFSIIDEDFNPNFEYNASLKKKMGVLLPEMYKQTRDSKPFNIIKYLITTFISLILAIIISIIFTNSFCWAIIDKNGETSSIYDLIFFTYLAIIIIHFFMIYTDSSLFNYIIIVMFLIQVLIDILFIIIMDKIKNDNKLNGITSKLINNINFLTLIISCACICLPFYILRRMEFYFGINIANFIKTKSINEIFEGKYYKTKITQMIRALTAINKFKKIKREISFDDKMKYDNLNDINMEKAVKQYNKIEKNKK